MGDRTLGRKVNRVIVDGMLPCTKCKQVLPTIAFGRDSRRACGYRSHCEACRGKACNVLRGIKRGCRYSPVTVEGEKWCYACKTVRPLSCYRKNRRMKDGYSSECNACGLVLARKRYEKKRIAELAASTTASLDECAHHLKHRHLSIVSKPLNIKEPKPLLTFQCEQCGKSITALRKRKFCEDRCIWKSNTRHRKFMRRLRMGDKSKQDRIDLAMLLERDGFECGLCHEPIHENHKYPHPMSGTIDHIIPLSKGGTHQWVNVQAAHARCNLKKHARIVDIHA